MLPGTKRTQYLEENAAAFHITLSMAEQEALESIFHPDQVFSLLCIRLWVCRQLGAVLRP